MLLHPKSHAELQETSPFPPYVVMRRLEDCELGEFPSSAQLNCSLCHIPKPLSSSKLCYLLATVLSTRRLSKLDQFLE